jgi:hypothetical protein
MIKTTIWIVLYRNKRHKKTAWPVISARDMFILLLNSNTKINFNTFVSIWAGEFDAGRALRPKRRCGHSPASVSGSNECRPIPQDAP